MSWKFGSTLIVISVSLYFHAANIRVCAHNTEDEDGAQVCPPAVQCSDASRVSLEDVSVNLKESIFGQSIIHLKG